MIDARGAFGENSIIHGITEEVCEKQVLGPTEPVNSPRS
jgi:hypothetical protein